MEPVRVGIIGCGVIGTSHMRAANESPDIELIAAADLIDANREKAEAQFSPKRMYTDGADLVADAEIELVVLAFPTAYRGKVGLDVLGAGKHLLTEKPVAMNAGEVKALIAARGDLQAACCSSRYRFTKGAEVATELIASGALGELRTVRHRNLSAAGKLPTSPRPEWRLKKHLNGGGYLVNWGCYDLDYLLGITGWSLKPLTVFAQTWTVPPPYESHIAPGSDAETHYTAMIRCEGGTILAIERSEFTAAERDEAWGIIGSEGSLRLAMTASKPGRIVHAKANTVEGTSAETLWEEDEDRSIHAGPLTDLARAIREGRPPKTSLEQALVVQQITDAVYLSAETGEAVPIQ
jgi:UDP-N-acetyl-2-amino-2-deoxyglucuronate dehydrogenase